MAIAPQAAAASTPPATPAAAKGYVDQLIGGSSPPDREQDEADRRARDDSPGLRSWAAELRVESREVTGSGRTDTAGLGLRYGWETEYYGDFLAIAQMGRVQPGPNDPLGDRQRLSATLFHENFALTDRFVMNSALGVVRPTLPPWLSVSHRVFLSPALIRGFSTTVGSPDQEFRFTAGQLGQYAGFGVQLFERIPGETASATYTQRLPGDWLVGGTAVTVKDSRSIADHSAFSVAAQHGLRGLEDGVKVQAAGTDDGELAGWIDAQKRIGRLTQRLGAYHLDPDFKFGQSLPLRDTRGAYWRGDYRAAGNAYSGGVEYIQDNLRKDPRRGGNDSAGAFGTVTLRLDRTMQVGGGLSARNERPRTEGGVLRNVYGANLFLSKETPWGIARLDANTNVSRPRDLPGERTTVVNWNQEWNAFAPVSLHTVLSYSDERLVDRHVKRRTAGVAARGPFYGTVHWDASLTFVDTDGTLGSERNYNSALALDWSPLPAWVLQLTWNRNRIQPGPDNPLSPFFQENTVQLNLRYEDSAGASYPRLTGAGRSGTGAVVGSVFFDENGDGARAPNERGAPGVSVVLDERQSATTDSDGRFKFPLVSTGRHTVRVLLERVALPWGLENDGPREVSVEVRTDARLEIGLTRVAP